ncbi:hypothetical protein GOQ27_16130 [Clostridium sp. D2Q-11]|uniref:Type 4 fimbrial biogenesis protein PilX N-terminal domain-containing protein n=1 Tax=Anaeromonas frigoriresistens TaxID=2683708 RepID=A0A942Z7X8_9FIRM|nr:hypothetical protein [Anaeromonas frigoriresistens]MBS4540006.1 hypothetical protein [Anaeromonas frigoriresistens]
MDKRAINNKGSVLIMLLIVFSILTVLGTTIYSVAVTNYKIETVSGKRKENLYLAEAGIEEAHLILTNVIEEAIDIGNQAATEIVNNIKIADKESDYILDDGSIDWDKVYEKQETVFKASYKKHIEENLEDTINDMTKYSLIKKENYIITSEYDKDQNTIGIRSKFSKDDIKREVFASYKLLEPPYNQSYYYHSNIVEVPKDILFTKGLYTEKNLKNDSNELKIKGDIYVKGDIFIGTSTNSNIEEFSVKEGDTIAYGDIRVNSNNGKTIDFSGDTHANNFIIDKESKNSTVDITTLYTKDDLEIEGSKTNITIDNYYGYTYGEHGHMDGRDVAGPADSSSINIESSDLGNGTSLKITNEMRVLGTSFVEKIELEDKELKYDNGQYQTGESISIKGNYRAYTKILNLTDVVSYYPPFMFVNKSINGKANHFIEYKNETTPHNLILGNESIDIPASNITSLGITLDNGEIKEPKVSQYNFYWKKLQGEVENLKGKLKNGTIKNRLDIENNKNDNFLSNEKNEIICITDKDVYISGKNDTHTGENVIDADDAIKGIIITSGKVILSGKIDFTGTIIAGDDIEIKNGSKVELTYDEDYLLKLLGQNLVAFKDLFTKDPEETIPTLIHEELGVENNSRNDMDKFIKIIEWKLNL